jgi:hypothetical protein
VKASRITPGSQSFGWRGVHLDQGDNPDFARSTADTEDGVVRVGAETA